MKEVRLRDYLLLHGVLLLYALVSVLSKLASGFEVFSLPFLLLYGAKLALLVLYAVLWREMLKKFTLSGAYLQKTVTVLWGLLIGVLLFEEPLTRGKIIGSVLIMAGLGLAVTDRE